jgi:uncharacterized protein (DUF2062 family)
MEKKVVKTSNNQVIWKLKTELGALKEEIRNDVSGPVVASFGFIIALIWRDAIRSTIDAFLERAGLLEKMWIYDIVSAIIVTIFVIGIMIFVTKFSQRKRRKKIERAVKEKLDKFKD